MMKTFPRGSVHEHAPLRTWLAEIVSSTLAAAKRKAMTMFNLRRASAIGLVLSSVWACGSESGSDGTDPVPPFAGALGPATPPPAVPNAPPAANPGPASTPPEAPAPSTNPTAPAGTEGNTPDLPIVQPEQPTPPAGGGGAGGTGAEEPAPEEPAPDPELPPGVDPNFFIFLTFGQSNMEGVPLPEAQDRQEDPRVKVLAYDNCANLGRTYNQWYTASPPLHSCNLGVGPGDYFGKTLAAALPANVTIGIVPNAIAGVDIDFFRKGVRSARRGEFRIPPDNQRDSAYDMIIERGRLAQQVGVIKGIIFHQGESDSGSPNRDQWVGKLQQIVSDIRTDLNIGNVPFVAGELLYNAQGGCCGDSLNPLINSLPNVIDEAFVVSANGLTNIDNFHFTLPSQRTFGARYGAVMLDALGLGTP
jgi:carbohydrate esterase-like sialic acid-specific acetylesterase